VLVGVEALTRRVRLRKKSGMYASASPAALGDTDVRAEVERYEGTEADVYSVGATLFVLIFGEAPFTDCDGIDGLIDAKYAPPRMPNAAFENSPQLRDLLLRFMAPQPSSRITIEGAMEHEWVTVEGTDPMERISYRLTTDAAAEGAERSGAAVAPSATDAHLAGEQRGGESARSIASHVAAPSRAEILSGGVEIDFTLPFSGLVQIAAHMSGRSSLARRYYVKPGDARRGGGVAEDESDVMSGVQLRPLRPILGAVLPFVVRNRMCVSVMYR
jgi:serine/threonine protein kinase